MRILVIGATGQTGQLVLEQGLRRGHAITAFTRHPQALEAVQGLKAVVYGDAFILDDVRKALHEQDAVISAVGSSDIAFNLIKAMPEAGVRRLVMTSSRSVVATRPQLAVTLAWLFLREILRRPRQGRRHAPGQWAGLDHREGDHAHQPPADRACSY